MSLEITGKLHKKFNEEKISESYSKREFVVEMQKDINGNTYLDYPKFQLSKNKFNIIDNFKEGDMVKVSFNLKGRMWTRKTDGKEDYITNLEAWRIENANATPNTNANAQAAAPAYNNTGGNSSQANNFNATANVNPAPEPVDDLPF